MSLRSDIVRFANELEEQAAKAHDLWSWLPSCWAAQKHHGDLHFNHEPTMAGVLEEASSVLCAVLRGGKIHEQWLSCPCDEHYIGETEEKDPNAFLTQEEWQEKIGFITQSDLQLVEAMRKHDASCREEVNKVKLELERVKREQPRVVYELTSKVQAASLAVVNAARVIANDGAPFLSDKREAILKALGDYDAAIAEPPKRAKRAICAGCGEVEALTEGGRVAKHEVDAEIGGGTWVECSGSGKFPVE